MRWFFGDSATRGMDGSAGRTALRPGRGGRRDDPVGQPEGDNSQKLSGPHTEEDDMRKKTFSEEQVTFALPAARSRSSPLFGLR